MGMRSEEALNGGAHAAFGQVFAAFDESDQKFLNVENETVPRVMQFPGSRARR